MDKIQLGKIEKASISEIFGHEERVFTPWLAENIDELNNVLGLNLTSAETEVPVGPYFCDIVARDENENAVVIIENQKGKTNHDHLEKLLPMPAV